MYLCSGMYKSYQFLAKEKATSTSKLFDSLPWLRNDMVAELCSGEYKVANCHDPNSKLPALPPMYIL
jgi:hypothetical protein